MSEKPHHGRIRDWVKINYPEGAFVYGRAVDHPRFAGSDIQTSYVLSHDEATGEIETRNSRYTLVGGPAA